MNDVIVQFPASIRRQARPVHSVKVCGCGGDVTKMSDKRWPQAATDLSQLYRDSTRDNARVTSSNAMTPVTMATEEDARWAALHRFLPHIHKFPFPVRSLRQTPSIIIILKLVRL